MEEKAREGESECEREMQGVRGRKVEEVEMEREREKKRGDDALAHIQKTLTQRVQHCQCRRLRGQQSHRCQSPAMLSRERERRVVGEHHSENEENSNNNNSK